MRGKLYRSTIRRRSPKQLEEIFPRPVAIVNSFVCRIAKEPTDLISMQYAMQLFEKLTNDIPQEEEEFPKIREQYQTLGKPLNDSSVCSCQREDR